MSKAKQGYAHLVAGASVRTVELDVPESLLARARALASRHGWDEDWGEDAPLVVFYHGLAALELERAAAELDTGNPAAVAREASRLRQRRMWLDGQYAVLRFHLFELIKNNRIMSVRENALRNDNEGLRHRLERFERDRAGLARQLAGGPKPAAEPGPEAGAVEQAGRLERGLFVRLRAWLGHEPEG